MACTHTFHALMHILFLCRHVEQPANQNRTAETGRPSHRSQGGLCGTWLPPSSRRYCCGLGKSQILWQDCVLRRVVALLNRLFTRTSKYINPLLAAWTKKQLIITSKCHEQRLKRCFTQWLYNDGFVIVFTVNSHLFNITVIVSLYNVSSIKTSRLLYFFPYVEVACQTSE